MRVCKDSTANRGLCSSPGPVVMVDNHGDCMTNLGQMSSVKQYKDVSDALVVEYSNGDACSGKQ